MITRKDSFTFEQYTNSDFFCSVPWKAFITLLWPADQPFDISTFSRKRSFFFQGLTKELGKHPYFSVLEFSSTSNCPHLHIVYGSFVPFSLLRLLWGAQFDKINPLRYESLTNVKAITDIEFLLQYILKDIDKTSGRTLPALRPWTTNKSLEDLLEKWLAARPDLSPTLTLPSLGELYEIQKEREVFALDSSFERLQKNCRADRAVILSFISHLANFYCETFESLRSGLSKRFKSHRVILEVDPIFALRAILIQFSSYGSPHQGSRTLPLAYASMGRAILDCLNRRTELYKSLSNPKFPGYEENDSVDSEIFQIKVGDQVISLAAQVFKDILSINFGLDFVFSASEDPEAGALNLDDEGVVTSVPDAQPRKFFSTRFSVTFNILSEDERWKDHFQVVEKFKDFVSRGWSEHPPMVSPPSPWSDSKGAPLTHNFSGGYILNGSNFKIPLVRPNSSSQLVPITSSLFEAVNKVQGTPLTLDENLLSFLLQYYNVTEQRLNSLLHTFKGKGGKSSPALQKEYSFCLTLFNIQKEWKSIKEDTRGLNIFYFPYFYDFRGRLYPQTTVLSHVSSKIARSLIRFAKHPVSFDEKVFALYASRLFFYERTLSQNQYLEKFEKELRPRMSAWTPESGPHFHTEAHEPFMFLSCLFEWHRYSRYSSSDSYQTRFPVFFDATASGSQIVSLLRGDRSLAAKANLTPSTPADPVGDVYMSYINEYLAIVKNEGWWISKDSGYQLLTPKDLRKLFKTSIMASLYGVTATGMRRQIMSELKTLSLKYKLPGMYSEGKLLVSSFYSFIKKTPLFDFLQLCSKLAKLYTNLKIRPKISPFLESQVPSGSFIPIFLVHVLICQAYIREDKRVLDLGRIRSGTKKVPFPRQRKQITIKVPRRGELSLARQRLALTAHIVHGLDGAINRFIIHSLSGPVLPVHDCWGVPMNSVDALRNAYNEALRETFGVSDALSKIAFSWLTDLEPVALASSEYAPLYEEFKRKLTLIQEERDPTILAAISDTVNHILPLH